MGALITKEADQELTRGQELDDGGEAAKGKYSKVQRIYYVASFDQMQSVQRYIALAERRAKDRRLFEITFVTTNIAFDPILFEEKNEAIVVSRQPTTRHKETPIRSCQSLKMSGSPPSFNIGLVCTAIATIVERDRTTAPHITLFTKAYEVYITQLKNEDRGIYILNERVYMELYNDVRENREFWWNSIFVHIRTGTSVFVPVMMMLETLGSIRVRRNDVTTCQEILQLRAHFLRKWRAITIRHGSWNLAADLTYDYNALTTQATLRALNKVECLKAFRAAARYEIEHDRDHRPMASLLEPLLSARMGLEPNMSVEDLDQSTDDEIWAFLVTQLQYPISLHSWFGGVEPWICDGCGEEEELCGDLKRCSRCRKVRYCSRDCQRKHWEMHRPDCSSANELSPELLKDVKTMCQSTIRNYAEAIKTAGGQDASKEIMTAVFPVLVQLIRKHISEHPDLNPEDAFGSSVSDVQFREKIDALIVAEAGTHGSRLQSITNNRRLDLIATEKAESYQDPLLQETKCHVVSCLPWVMAELNITPDAQQQNSACQHAVAELKFYVAEHPEYQSPESLAAALKSSIALRKVILSAFGEYFFFPTESK